MPPSLVQPGGVRVLSHPPSPLPHLLSVPSLCTLPVAPASLETIPPKAATGLLAPNPVPSAHCSAPISRAESPALDALDQTHLLEIVPSVYLLFCFSF